MNVGCFGETTNVNVNVDVKEKENEDVDEDANANVNVNAKVNEEVNVNVDVETPTHPHRSPFSVIFKKLLYICTRRNTFNLWQKKISKSCSEW